jgi:predicted RNase H-like nuclease (RuvC/YqgF family)
MNQILNKVLEEEEQLRLEVEQYAGGEMVVKAEFEYIKKIQELKSENDRLKRENAMYRTTLYKIKSQAERALKTMG